MPEYRTVEGGQCFVGHWSSDGVPMDYCVIESRQFTGRVSDTGQIFTHHICEVHNIVVLWTYQGIVLGERDGN